MRCPGAVLRHILALSPSLPLPRRLLPASPRQAKKKKERKTKRREDRKAFAALRKPLPHDRPLTEAEKLLPPIRLYRKKQRARARASARDSTHAITHTCAPPTRGE